MGYFAEGSGSAKLKLDADSEALTEILDEADIAGIEYEVDNIGFINFWETDDHWHNENTEEFLSILIPYITEGTADYYGEDNELWRYRYDASTCGEWIEESPHVDYHFETYSDEELISELENRGFTTEKSIVAEEKPDYTINRKYKDSLFRMLFGQEESKPDLLALYNALNGTAYNDPSELELYTMSDVLYMRMKNDVACMLHDSLSLFEHQSTVNPNMPLRGFLYFARMYERYIDAHDLNVYSSKLQKLPAPNYYILYNGEQNMPDRQSYCLSDAYEQPVTEGTFEWTATMININAGHNQKLMDTCGKLKEYAAFVEKVREYSQDGASLVAAVDKASKWCIRNHVLEGFLKLHEAEVKDMILTEYDEEKTMRLFKEEYKAEGLAEGEGKHALEVYQRCLAKGMSQMEAIDISGINEMDIVYLD